MCLVIYKTTHVFSAAQQSMCLPLWGEGEIKNKRLPFEGFDICYLKKKTVKWLSWEEKVRILFDFFSFFIYCSGFNSLCCWKVWIHTCEGGNRLFRTLDSWRFNSATLFMRIRCSDSSFPRCLLGTCCYEGVSALGTQSLVSWHLIPRQALGLNSMRNLLSVQFSRSVMSNSLQPHEPQHTRPPCPSPTPGVHPNPCLLSRWCHPTI